MKYRAFNPQRLESYCYTATAFSSLVASFLPFYLSLLSLHSPQARAVPFCLPRSPVITRARVSYRVGDARKSPLRNLLTRARESENENDVWCARKGKKEEVGAGWDARCNFFVRIREILVYYERERERERERGWEVQVNEIYFCKRREPTPRLYFARGGSGACKRGREGGGRL